MIAAHQENATRAGRSTEGGAGGGARLAGGPPRSGRVLSGAVFWQFAVEREAFSGVGAKDVRRHSLFAVGLVAACEARNQAARARMRLRHKNCRRFNAGARAEQGALPLSGQRPCAGRGGKQGAPSSPVAVLEP